MSKVLLRLSVKLFLISIFLSWAAIFCISDVQRASAAEMVLDENESGNGSENRDFFLTDLKEDVIYSEESITPAQKKLSEDLLKLCDERYLSGEESPASLRARMINLGQLGQEDPVRGRAAGPAEDAEVFSGSGQNVSKSSDPSSEPSLFSGDKVYVYIYLKPSANSSVLEEYCEIQERDEENHIAVSWVPLKSLETLASLSEVKSIQTVLPPFVRQENAVSEGDFILKSSSLRDSYGVNGTGIKIGIISDGVDSLEDSQAAGNISYDVNILSNKIGGNEGTAMLEIIQDIAPGAELYFHDCGSSRLEFNRAVDALVNEGCTVICDDIGWLSEPFFEDGIVANHINEIIKKHDLLYVSAAGNSGDSHYQGLFYDNGSGWHDFSSGQGEVKNLQLEIRPSGETWVFLQWNDRWEQSGNNYDLYLKNRETSEIIASSKVHQDGDDLPLEYIMYTNKGQNTLNASIEVKKVSGGARELELYIYYWPGVKVNPENIIAEDSIFGHPALPDAVTVGAVGMGESGDYEIENFSSIGPATIFYPSPEVRQKADISGPDGVNVTGAKGVSEQFFGTSASSPHVAGIAALVWSAFPEKSAMDIRRLLYTSSTDLGNPGYDTIFGHGLVDALKMYEQASGASSTFTVKPGGDGDFSSISDAVNYSRPGDSIFVYSGIYRENIDLPWSLNLSSASGKPEDTVLEAENFEEPVLHVTANSVNITGFSINGPSGAGIYLESAGSCELKNNRISGCTQGVLFECSSNSTLQGNNLSNNTEGLRLTDSFLNTIFENEFENGINVNESLSQNFPKEERFSGLPNNWNTAEGIKYLYNGGIYESRFGNFYSDYRGPDADGSGIGDLPYGSDSFPLTARPASYSTGFEIGNISPARDSASVEGDVLDFGIRSTRNCTFSWLINGTLVQTNESASSAVFSINTGELRGIITENSDTDPPGSKYNLTVIAANGSSFLQHSWNWTVYPAETGANTSGNLSEDNIIRSISYEGDGGKSTGGKAGGGRGGISSSPEPSGNIENRGTARTSPFSAAGQEQGETLQFSSHTAQNNSPGKGPDGAPELWVARENESGSSEEESGEDRNVPRNVPSLTSGTSIFILLAGALCIKRK